MQIGLSTGLEAKREEKRRAREKRRENRERRRTLTRPDPDERPRLLPGAWQRELPFRFASIFAITCTLVIGIYDIVRVNVSPGWNWHPLLGSRILAWTFLVISVCTILITITDLATYRPRLHVVSARASEEVFHKLGELDFTFAEAMKEVKNTPPRTWSQVVAQQELLLAATREFLLIDRLRIEVMARVLGKIVVVILQLSLIAYGATYASGDAFIRNMTSGQGLSEHVQFALSKFGTGAGSFTVANTLAGTAYLALDALVLIAITYFIVATVTTSFGQFETNITQAARNFVLRIGRL